MKKHSKKISKKDKVLAYLKRNKRGITGLEALQKFGLYRLSDAIFKLRNEGYHIVTTMEQPKDPDEAPYARYYLHG